MLFSKMSAWLKWILMLAFLLSNVLPANPALAQSDGGIAISGSFYRHHFKLVPGESFSSPDVDVIIFNNYAHDIDVVLTGEVPAGVKFDVEGKKITIPANTSITLAVGLLVEKTVVPGEYKIALSADVVPNNEAGIAIVGSAQLRTTLTVFGEAGTVTVTPLTPEGEPFAGEMHISQVENNQLVPASFANDVTLKDRLVPGKYQVVIYYQGTEVASQSFDLAANEAKDIKLTVKTVFVVGMTAAPAYNQKDGKITTARINYTLKNVYKPLKDVRTVLTVTRDGKPLDEIEMIAMPTFDLISQDSRYTYIPSDGWQGGEYHFKVSVFANGNVLQSESEDQLLRVESGLTNTWIYLIAAAAIIAVLAFLFAKGIIKLPVITVSKR